MTTGPGWRQLDSTGRRTVEVGGRELGRGSRVVLRPGSGGDIFDMALAGQTARVESIEEDTEGNVMVAVTVDSDPGADLGIDRRPGHRFFFGPGELEPMATEADAPRSRVLVAGIGNVFMADDGFGVALANRLAEGAVPPGVDVEDFGIRGMDLVYALGAGYDAAILLDCSPRGGEPGTVYVLEPEIDEEQPVALETHGMDPARVLRLARELGPIPDRTLVVACEPAVRMTGEEGDVVVKLSPPVRAALDEAERMVRSLLRELVPASEQANEGGRG
jgi:hydrogenase maturation protease